MSGVMGAKVRTLHPERTHSAASGVSELRRTDRAQDRQRWATTRVPSRTLAKHYGVSAAHARSLRTRDAKGPLTKLLAMIADPEVEAGPLVAAVLSAYEERSMYAPTDVLRARRDRLRAEIEHEAEARQNRAMVLNAPDRSDAYRDHAAVLIELATLEEMLG